MTSDLMWLVRIVSCRCCSRFPSAVALYIQSAPDQKSARLTINIHDGDQKTRATGKYSPKEKFFSLFITPIHLLSFYDQVAVEEQSNKPFQSQYLHSLSQSSVPLENHIHHHSEIAN